jgi:DUF4097 and DUF4098 domain-containing protein YvlB
MAVDINGNLSVDTRFGLVKAERIHGSLEVENANGGVTASDIAGSARVRTSFASVYLKGVNGPVSVENQNGSIVVSGLRGSCDNVTLKTSFAPIKVALPASASYSIEARTSFGSISTDVPINVSKKSENTLTGTIGSGGCKMELTTSNGGISITRE